MTRLRPLAALALTALMAIAPMGRAAEAAPSDPPAKRGYGLFRPVPRERMRELSTDRPDMTESPYTVDAGHFQLEADVVSFSRDTERQVRAERLGVATTNVKVGLTPSLDVQLIAPLCVRDRLVGAFSGSPDARSGIGDLTVRAKLNLWGNDGGRSAMAILPFAELPTRRLDEGTSTFSGLDVLLALALPRGFDVGSMLQLGVEGESRSLLGTMTVGHALVGPLGGYLEISGARVIRGGDETQATFNSGVTWGISPDVQLDGGIVLGVTDRSEDFAGFVGLAVRR